MLKRKSRSRLHRSAIHRAALVEPLERRLLLSGTITAVQGQNFDVGDLDGSANVFVPAGVSVSATQIRENSLTVSGNLQMDLSTNGVFDPSGVSIVNSLTLTTNASTGAFIGTLDLSNDVLIIRAGNNNFNQQSQLLGTIDAAIANAYGTGVNHWTGTGITTSAVPLYGGIAGGIASMINNTATNGSNGGPVYTTFAGQSVGQNDIILTYDAMGDAQMTGYVNFTDTQIVSANIGTTGTWRTGDFDTPGPVKYQDLQLVDSNYNSHLPISTAPQATLTAPQYLDTFSDTTDPISNLSATVDFGDGSGPGPAAIVDDGSGSFSVFADHTYFQTGSDTTSTAISNTTGLLTTDPGSATVTGIIATGLTTPTTTGESATVPVATFTDNSPDSAALTYTATVDWGDADDPTPAMVSSPVNGVYTVTADQTFSDPSTYDATVTIDDSNGSFASANGEVDATDAPLTATPEIISPIVGTPYSGTVATFNYNNPSATASQFQATISWGDGTTSDGTITSDGNNDGGFTVTGANTFVAAGTDYPVVTIYDPFGDSATADATALVEATTADVTDPGPPTANEAQPYTLFLGPIAPTSGTVNSWTINWGDGSPAQNLPASATFVQHTFATATSSASISYTAYNVFNDPMTSGTWSVTVLPAAPTNLSASWSGDSTVALTWSEQSALATTVAIEQSVNGGTFTFVTNVSAAAGSATLSNLDNSAAYTFEAFAGDAAGESSPPVSFTLLAAGGTAELSPPSLSGSAVSPTELDLVFTDPAPDGSHLEMEEMGPADTNFHTIGLPGAESTGSSDHLITGLTPHTEYYFRLRADQGGQVAYSSEVDLITPSDTAGSLDANIELNPDPDNGEGNILVSWKGPDGVVVDARSTISDNLYLVFPEDFELNNPTSDGNGGWYEYANLWQGINYSARVESGAYPNVSYSNWQGVSVPSDRPAPTNLQETPDPSTYTTTFTWDYSGDLATTQFALLAPDYYPSTQVLDTDGDEIMDVTGQTSMTISGLGTGNYFLIACSPNSGDEGYFPDNSAPSNFILAPVAATSAPAAPANLKAYLASDDTVNLVWDNTPNNETGFTVLEKLDTDPDTDWQTVGGSDADMPYATVTLTDPTTAVHDFEVVAFNGSGTSLPSNTTRISDGTSTVPQLYSASFSEGGEVQPQTVLRDTGTQLPYDDPQWVDASLTGDVAGDHGSGFLDGTEDNGATEHSFPISVMRSLPGHDEPLDVSLQLAFTGTITGNPMIEGSGDGFDFAATVAKAAGGYLTAQLQSTQTVPETIDSQDLAIQWQYSTDGHTWVNVGSSDNHLFVTGAAAPQAFETVLYIGCTAANGLEPSNPGELNPGSTLANQYLANTIMQAFGTGGPANPSEVNGSMLEYWGLTSLTPPNFTTRQLLDDADGRCGAWANFLEDVLLAQGVEGVHYCDIEPSAAEQTKYNEAITDGVVYPTLPGQGNPTPSYIFAVGGVHAVLEIDGINSVFDPSYGMLYTGPTLSAAECLWENTALEGWVVAGRGLVPHVVAPPQETVFNRIPQEPT